MATPGSGFWSFGSEDGSGDPDNPGPGRSPPPGQTPTALAVCLSQVQPRRGLPNPRLTFFKPAPGLTASCPGKTEEPAPPARRRRIPVGVAKTRLRETTRRRRRREPAHLSAAKGTGSAAGESSALLDLSQQDLPWLGRRRRSPTSAGPVLGRGRGRWAGGRGSSGQERRRTGPESVGSCMQQFRLALSISGQCLHTPAGLLACSLACMLIEMNLSSRPPHSKGARRVATHSIHPYHQR